MYLKTVIFILLMLNSALGESLVAYIQKLERNHNIKIGVSATNLITDESFHHHQHEHFKMASTVKLPLAVMFLKQVEQKRINFDQLVEVKPNDLVPGSGKLGYFVLHPGFKISYRNLFEPMLTISDNTATDLIFTKIGGASSLRNFLELNGYKDIWVARTISEIYFDARGYPKMIKYENRTLSWWQDEWAKIKIEPKVYYKFANQYRLDFRDTTTTHDMNRFLIDISRHKVITAKYFDYLFDVMTRCATSDKRIRKYLPKDTIIADKTGTWDMASSYVGDIGYLKTKKDQLISFAIYVEGKGDLTEENHFAEAIALIGKKLYEEM